MNYIVNMNQAIQVILMMCYDCNHFLSYHQNLDSFSMSLYLCQIYGFISLQYKCITFHCIIFPYYFLLPIFSSGFSLSLPVSLVLSTPLSLLFFLCHSSSTFFLSQSLWKECCLFRKQSFSSLLGVRSKRVLRKGCGRAEEVEEQKKRESGRSGRVEEAGEWKRKWMG